MNKELFGVFGDEEAFRSLRSPMEFDRLVSGPDVTVGVRDVGLGIPGRTDWADSDEDDDSEGEGDGAGAAVVWGEAYLPASAASPAEWLRRTVPERGTAALDRLNGSYVAVCDAGDGEPFVATDPTRTWECYYTDAPGVRVFGTDPAAVANTVPQPTLDRGAMLEFLHLTVVLGDRTPFEELRRVPFDGLLTRREARELSRFVYEPREFDYVAELADRLERALLRRRTNPGRKGLLLSGGYDSRLFLSGIPDIDVAYTIGRSGGDEAAVARRVAEQYDTPHRTLEADRRYLNTAFDDVQYGLGIKESIHVHQAGYEPQMNVDTVYHGLLFDTYLRGHFLPRDGVDVLGVTLPRNRLDPDPDPAAVILSKFGFMGECQESFGACDDLPESAVEFGREAIERRFPAPGDRAESVYNRLALFGIQNQPSTPFRHHLADHFLESFVAADAELLDWHLSTPPEYRNTETFKRALKRIDPDVLRHRPPDRPRDSHTLNQIEGFVRRKLPGLHAFEHSWPDRRDLYEAADLDATLFPASPEIHDLPPRLKLRINDLTTWTERAVDDGRVAPVDVLCSGLQRGSRSESGHEPPEPSA